MKPPFSAPILRQLARSAGVTIRTLPDWEGFGQIVLPDGRITYFIESTFDLNPQGAARIARDKDAAARFMRELGHPVPAWRKFFSRGVSRQLGLEFDLHRMFDEAAALGRPIVLKPNSGGQGSDVCLVWDRAEFEEGAKKIFRRDGVMLAQTFVSGRDHRIVVLDGEVLCAYERTPPTVTGDGRRTIAELAAARNAEFDRTRRSASLRVDSARTIARLRREGLDPESVPRPGVPIRVLDVANLSSGGEMVERSESLHDDYRRFAVAVTRDMGLRYSGLDLMIPGDIREPLAGATVIEINASPGFRQYASFGPEQAARVVAIHKRILDALAHASGRPG